MKILTLEEVIGMNKGVVIPGLTGKITRVMKAGPSSFDPTKIKQLVILSDGTGEICLSIDDPDTHGGDVPLDAAGKKIYAWAGISKKGAPCGLTRGGDTERKDRPGQFSRYVNLQGEAEWGFQDRSLPTEKPKKEHEDDVPMDFSEPTKKSEAQEYGLSFDDAVPKKEPEKKSTSGTTEATQKTEATKTHEILEVSLAKIGLQYKSCIEVSIEIAKSLRREIGDATGEAVTLDVLIGMSNKIFDESNRRKIWG